MANATLRKARTIGMLILAMSVPIDRMGGEDPPSAKSARVVVTGHDVNRPAPFPGQGKFGWAGNVARLEDGRLMLVHTAGYYHVSFAEPRLIEKELRKQWLAEGWPLDFPAPTGGRSMATYSSDDGRTWSQPETIIDLPLDDGSYGVLRLADNTLLCFINVQASWYGFSEAPPQFRKDIDGLNSQQCVIRSTDGGKTWSEPIWPESPGNFYQRSHAQPIVLPSGSILWPTYAIEYGAPEFGVIQRSDDNGKSWRVVSTIRREKQLVDEPAITRLADGRLLLVCRPDGGLAYSEDEGKTWTFQGRLIEKGRFKAPRLLTMEDGTVVCVATLGRLYVFLGRAHGTDWVGPFALDTESYGYPGGMQLEDGSFLISYCSSGRAPNRIYVVRFRVKEARDGIEILAVGDAGEK